MKERPVLFNGNMVRAILSGRKTQTRRVINPQPSSGVRKSVLVKSGVEDGHGRELVCPLGQTGDQLWVRETFATGLCTKTTMAYKASHKAEDLEEGWLEKIKWRPSIHMPRWASRIQLEITNVGVQRLQDISSGDVVREGICQLPASGRYCINPGDQYLGGASHDAREVFYWLWDSIYDGDSKRCWQANPWVWVAEFKLLAPAGELS